MKILVTGGAGFIGGNFVHYMVNKYPEDMIVNLDKLTYAGNLETCKPVEDKPNYKFIKGDIADREFIMDLFEKEKFDVVVNFAAESHVDRSIEDPEIFVKTNVMGTTTLLDACVKYGIQRYHQVSTDEVYGDLPLDRPDLFFTENTPLHTSSPYSSAKASADLFVLAYHRTYGLPVTISRCSNNYGPYHFPEKLIPLIISRALNDETIPVYGTGENVRDWLHVYDHCVAIDLIVRKGRVGEVYNVGGHNERTNLEVVKTVLHALNICKELGKPESLITYVTDRKGHDMRYAIDPTKLETELGWKPKYTFDTGIPMTIQWYLDNKEWWENIISGEYQNYFEKMYVEKNNIVKKDQILAVIKNSANVDDVLWLKLVMDSISTEQYKNKVNIFASKKNLELGDLTNSFSELQKAIEAYDIFCRLKTFEKKQQALLKEIQHTNSYEQSLLKKYELENANCDIAAQAFTRDSTLFVGNAATMIEYEQAKSLLIQKKVTLMTNKVEIENIRIQKSQLAHALIENTDQLIEKEKLLIKDMEIAFKNMRTELNQWIQTFAIVAPYDGKASFSKYWSIGQYVTPGEEVMTIIPVENQLVGKLLLPTAKSGKVKIGQKVNIKLDSYPYIEFGVVQGTVQAISMMPYEKNYLVDVTLPNGLYTNYGKNLQFSQEMPGTAEIITEDVTLFDRIYNPIRSVLVNIKK